MYVVFISDGAFPHGTPGASRIVSYAKYLVKAGVKVKIICFYPTHLFNPITTNISPEGLCDGVDYWYPAGTAYWPKKKTAVIKKVVLLVKSFFKTLSFLWHNRSEISIIQTYTYRRGLLKTAYFFSRLLRKPLVSERSELPVFYREKEFYAKTFRRRMFRRKAERSYRLPDAWFLETRTLADYYMSQARPSAALCIIPMTVDVQRFSNIKPTENKSYGRYIAYCGNMLEYDGISILIKAYSIIAPKYPDINLVLAGHSSDVSAQKKLVAELKLQDRVFFIGKIPGEEVPGLLSGAELLVLASPTSMRASATMPCKVGEYLCTTRPVVVTGQGELLNYLTDGIDAYLAEPDSAEAFAAKMNQALTDISLANEIGKRGREVAIREFSGEPQAEKIIKFYISLLGGERG